MNEAADPLSDRFQEDLKALVENHAALGLDAGKMAGHLLGRFCWLCLRHGRDPRELFDFTMQAVDLVVPPGSRGH